MKGSNIPIIKNKRHPRPLSNINGKTKQFKNNQVCRATLCKTDQTRIARLFCRLSCKERREDALALRADERRDKLRKAAVRSKYPLTRRCLNGETRLSKPQSPYTESIGIRHALNLNDMRQFAEMHDIEITVIDNDTRLPAFKDALRWNEVYYGFRTPLTSRSNGKSER